MWYCLWYFNGHSIERWRRDLVSSNPPISDHKTGVDDEDTNSLERLDGFTLWSASSICFVLTKWPDSTGFNKELLKLWLIKHNKSL